MLAIFCKDSLLLRPCTDITHLHESDFKKADKHVPSLKIDFMDIIDSKM